MIERAKFQLKYILDKVNVRAEKNKMKISDNKSN